MVRFRAQDGLYAVPVQDVRQVRAAEHLALLPMGREGVAGVVKYENGAFPVLSLLGSDGNRLLVLEVEGRRFGLLVQEVSGVTDVDEQRLGPPPDGQAGALIAAVMESGQDMALVIDASVLARHLVSDDPPGADPGVEAEDEEPTAGRVDEP
jgi:chemotaxis signal transduction protein